MRTHSQAHFFCFFTSSPDPRQGGGEHTHSFKFLTNKCLLSVQARKLEKRFCICPKQKQKTKKTVKLLTVQQNPPVPYRCTYSWIYLGLGEIRYLKNKILRNIAYHEKLRKWGQRPALYYMLHAKSFTRACAHSWRQY